MANTRPKAIDDIFDVNSNQFISGNVLDNDFDGDGQPLYLRFIDGVRVDAKGGGDTVTYIAGDYGNFAFKPDGSYTYFLDPWNPAVRALAPGQTLTETLSYKVSDGGGGTDVGTLKLSIAAPPPSTETLLVDFEDLAPGAVPDDYKGFDWIAGWAVATDTGAEWEPGNKVAASLTPNSILTRSDGGSFTFDEIDMSSLNAGEQIGLIGYVEGVARYFSSYGTAGGTWHFEPEFVGIDRLEIIGQVLIEQFVAIVTPDI